MNNTSKLIEILEKSPKSKKIEKLIKLSEFESAVDIPNQVERLMGIRLRNQHCPNHVSFPRFVFRYF